MNIKLGSKVRDIITGFEGIATARVEYLNGCIQYCITPKSNDGKYPDHQYIDHQQIEVVDDGVDISSNGTGGVMSNTPSY